MVSAIRRRPSKISGFTLVELLVVITIIGILMGLLIPAVQAARETARKTQCSTHINNLAKAAIQHEMTKREYPGWINDYGMFTGTQDPSTLGPSVAHAKIGTWAVDLLPYLDAQPTFEIWTQDKYPVITDAGEFTVNAAPNLAIMQCPSSLTLIADRGRNSYISNNGMNHTDAPQGVTAVQTMSRSNGVFNSKFGGVTGPAVRADDIKDGLSNTVLFSENLQAQPWNQLSHGDQATSAALLTATDTTGYSLPSRFPQGFVWHFRDSAVPAAGAASAVHKINGAGTGDLYGLEMNASNAADVARPSSAHNSGVNMGFADGATRFIMQTIDYRVYQALMTPRGKSSNVPFPEYVLDSDAI